ncbi:outer membrane beta-barrel protein [Hymenobacter sp. BT18]|uniref:type IX secretion system protein PorG n=1 Tax=Hymenobacter sp. BT18 TaxID=2835648 RepID=UPI00143E1CF8|nr:DUF6089 family protein [Hymenobacter sp. BT18]QIX62021.1 outer membrane beta-barrel protein [Hymenobacter sp. BT18]
MTQHSLFKTLLICSLQVGSVFFVHTAAFGQNTSELGLGLGALSYKGELAPEYRFANNRPAITAFYRKDVSKAVTLKGSVLAGLLRADDRQVRGLNNGPMPLNQYRSANLKGSLYELGGTLEYNFFDYYSKQVKTRFTPYAFVGVAGFMAPVRTLFTGTFRAPEEKNTVIGLAIPAGVGLKLGLSTHWNLGAEVGARKAFTDQLDNISTQNEVVANRHDQDWYYYGGFSISYTFYKIRCPEVTAGSQ